MNTGEAIALIKAFGGGGGGSSGGGVLVVNLTWNDDSGELDKTWQEIHDADAVVICQNEDNAKVYYTIDSVATLRDFVSGDTNYIVNAYRLADNARSRFVASSANGYPVYTEDA